MRAISYRLYTIWCVILIDLIRLRSRFSADAEWASEIENGRNITQSIRAWREARWLLIPDSDDTWQHDPQYCAGAGQHMCIGEFRYGAHPPLPDILCELFSRKGILHLNFCGDSYIRHLYVATLHLLTGNHINASLWPGYPPECEQHGQYEEKVRLLLA
jgi:hypothetical protein